MNPPAAPCRSSFLVRCSSGQVVMAGGAVRGRSRTPPHPDQPRPVREIVT